MKPECKGKTAARCLAAIVCDPAKRAWLKMVDPKILEQAERALEPFGWPDYKTLSNNLAASPVEHEAIT